jgi:4-hydroxy-4-methyl-2-oxoglutarate aldolase
MTAENPVANQTARTLAGFSTSILSDVRAGKGIVEPGLVRMAGTGTRAGRAITARCDEGAMSAVFAALDAAQPGDFLCIQGPGNTAYLGDLLATNLVHRGLAGAIVDGFVRDRAAIAGMPLTIMARGLTPCNLRRKGGGDAQVTLELPGVTLNPGDWVVADDDGVIVIASDDVEATLAQAARQVQVEARVRALILAGVKVPDAVREALAEFAR